MYKDKEKYNEYMRNRRKPCVNPKLNVNPATGGNVNPVNPALPQCVIDKIEIVLANRALLGLFDDREQRYQRAIDYHVWNENRLAELRS